MNMRDREYMVKHGYSDEIAEEIDNLASELHEECFTFGMDHFHILRKLRAAYELGVKEGKRQHEDYTSQG